MGYSSLSTNDQGACYERPGEWRLRARQAANENAFECCHTAQLHMAQLAFEAGHAEAALEHLKGYLTASVEDARDGCEGCGQPRCQDVAMLTCSGCRVARFCSVDHQKMASKKTSLGGYLWKERHKDICGVLGLWRNVLRLEFI